MARCTDAIQEVTNCIAKLAKKKNTKVLRYSRADIRASFAYSGAFNKDEIARAIADVLPEFAPHVPPMRKLWKSEDYRMGPFDALSRIFTFYTKEHLSSE